MFFSPLLRIALVRITSWPSYFAGPRGLGQGAPNVGGEGQIDTLSGTGEVLGNEGALYWTMRNGYALPTTEKSLVCSSLSQADKIASLQFLHHIFSVFSFSSRP